MPMTHSIQRTERMVAESGGEGSPSGKKLSAPPQPPPTLPVLLTPASEATESSLGSSPVEPRQMPFPLPTNPNHGDDCVPRNNRYSMAGGESVHCDE
ncbi:hypothetical protein EYF80_021384 [Liparis tanakae]|uniref:Uncharacterized protein n=1 Tax=Liparis tanakae TaxID=230148 RepID=A0A4Z2HS08_9TELE|nr:hypothetical protein EYF80_021384 [Liparis tanakae]